MSSAADGVSADALVRAHAAVEACLKAFSVLLPTGLARSPAVCTKVAAAILTQLRLPYELVYGYKQLQEESWSRAHMWLESPSGAITDIATLSIYHSIQILGQTFNFSGGSSAAGTVREPFYGITDVFIVPKESPKMETLRTAGADLDTFIDSNIKDSQQREALTRVVQTSTDDNTRITFEGVPIDMLHLPPTSNTLKR
jgi:hypothetical protein